ncbi:uncharacterized protein TNCV_4370251 [Trichonephila clavipes]|nr:uncharacterized protein TNCV_4370251 [Trichonephila clavipes]
MTHRNLFFPQASIGNVLRCPAWKEDSVFTLADGAKQSFSLRGKNRLRIFTLRLKDGAHRYHCCRRKPTSDINKALTGGAQRTSLNQSPGDPSRGLSTADSHWLGTRACAVLAISLRCQSMFRYFTARLEILTLKLGEWGATSAVLLVTQLKFQITRSMSVEFVTLPTLVKLQKHAMEDMNILYLASHFTQNGERKLKV